MRARKVSPSAVVTVLTGPSSETVFDVLHPQVGAEPQGLLAHLVHQLGTGDARTEAGEVLDLGGGHQRAAERSALEDHGCQLGARGVDGRGVSGRAGSDDDDVVHGRLTIVRGGGHTGLSDVCRDAAGVDTITNTRVCPAVPRGAQRPYGRGIVVSATKPVSAELQFGATARAVSVPASSPASTNRTAGRLAISTGRAPSTCGGCRIAQPGQAGRQASPVAQRAEIGRRAEQTDDLRIGQRDRGGRGRGGDEPCGGDGAGHGGRRPQQGGGAQPDGGGDGGDADGCSCHA